jgi:hypothetical protein
MKGGKARGRQEGRVAGRCRGCKVVRGGREEGRECDIIRGAYLKL